MRAEICSSQQKECGDSEEGSAALCVEIGGADRPSNESKGETGRVDVKEGVVEVAVRWRYESESDVAALMAATVSGASAERPERTGRMGDERVLAGASNWVVGCIVQRYDGMMAREGGVIEGD
jgi:hypothetical protein